MADVPVANPGVGGVGGSGQDPQITERRERARKLADRVRVNIGRLLEIDEPEKAENPQQVAKFGAAVIDAARALHGRQGRVKLKSPKGFRQDKVVTPLAFTPKGDPRTDQLDDDFLTFVAQLDQAVTGGDTKPGGDIEVDNDWFNRLVAFLTEAQGIPDAYTETLDSDAVETRPGLFDNVQFTPGVPAPEGSFKAGMLAAHLMNAVDGEGDKQGRISALRLSPEQAEAIRASYPLFQGVGDKIEARFKELDNAAGTLDVMKEEKDLLLNEVTRAIQEVQATDDPAAAQRLPALEQERDRLRGEIRELTNALDAYDPDTTGQNKLLVQALFGEGGRAARRRFMQSFTPTVQRAADDNAARDIMMNLLLYLDGKPSGFSENGEPVEALDRMCAQCFDGERNTWASQFQDQLKFLSGQTESPLMAKVGALVQASGRDPLARVLAAIPTTSPTPPPNPETERAAQAAEAAAEEARQAAVAAQAANATHEVDVPKVPAIDPGASPAHQRVLSFVGDTALRLDGDPSAPNYALSAESATQVQQEHQVPDNVAERIDNNHAQCTGFRSHLDLRRNEIAVHQASISQRISLVEQALEANASEATRNAAARTYMGRGRDRGAERREDIDARQAEREEFEREIEELEAQRDQFNEELALIDKHEHLFAEPVLASEHEVAQAVFGTLEPAQAEAFIQQLGLNHAQGNALRDMTLNLLRYTNRRPSLLNPNNEALGQVESASRAAYGPGRANAHAGDFVNDLSFLVGNNPKYKAALEAQRTSVFSALQQFDEQLTALTTEIEARQQGPGNNEQADPAEPGDPGAPGGPGGPTDSGGPTDPADPGAGGDTPPPPPGGGGRPPGGGRGSNEEGDPDAQVRQALRQHFPLDPNYTRLIDEGYTDRDADLLTIADPSIRDMIRTYRDEKEQARKFREDRFQHIWGLLNSNMPIEALLGALMLTLTEIEEHDLKTRNKELAVVREIEQANERNEESRKDFNQARLRDYGLEALAEHNERLHDFDNPDNQHQPDYRKRLERKSIEYGLKETFPALGKTTNFSIAKGLAEELQTKGTISDDSLLQAQKVMPSLTGERVRELTKDEYIQRGQKGLQKHNADAARREEKPIDATGERAEQFIQNKASEMAKEFEDTPNDPRAIKSASSIRIDASKYGLSGKSTSVLMQDVNMKLQLYTQTMQALSSIIKSIQDLLSAIVRNFR